ncbi:MAG TPA: Tat proofreading chaperone DmsD [Candidatus Aveggerthella excrementigallinarum]|nr:Tat proofreading chaperone DmsD [Candidatus Aveggerthella excrementigallinarum]
MNELLNDSAVREAVIFVGQTLGPLFLDDPRHEEQVVPAIKAFAALDVDAAAEEWPFVDADDARGALALMKEGAQAGAQSDEVVWEYRRLFVGPAPKPAPPWGSVYTDRECVVFGGTCLELRQWMREVGIERLGDEKDPEDHIGLMLLLVAWIAEHRPEVLEDCLRLHVLPWSSHLLEELEDAAEQPLYKGVARLARMSLEGMQEAFGIEVAYPRFYR